MEKLKIETRIVIPGEFIDELGNKETGLGTYIKNNKIYSEVIGILRNGESEVSVIPLNCKYIPKHGDRIIGKVKSIEMSGWMIDINSPYIGFLPVSEGVEEFVDNRTDISQFFNLGDIILCRVSRVTNNKSTQCSMKDNLARKLVDGVIIKVTPSKIPRIIGKSGSMINLIKEKTGTDIFTGQNGIVWIGGKNSDTAIKAIELINK